MASLNISIKQNKKNKTLRIELDANKFEKLASLFGLFSSDFLKSITIAEKNYQNKQIKKIKSLKDLAS